jgi:uncharacterized membrane protein YccC
VLGAALSSFGVAAVAGMLVVMAGATFSTVYGGYMASHVSAIALGYSLSVLEPLGELPVADRVAGWAIGGVAALVAALVLWPIERRTGLRRTASSVAGDLSRVLAELGRPAVARQRLTAATGDVSTLQARLATPLRPYGPASRDIAMVHLIEHLDQCAELVVALIDGGATEADDPLVADVGAGLERVRAVLAGEQEPRSAVRGLEALDEARAAGLVALASEAAQETSDEARPLQRMRVAIPLLALSHVVLWLEYDAARVMGESSQELPALATAPEVPRSSGDGIRSLAGRAGRLALSELDPDGVILRNSIRAGVALAAAVALAEILPVEHGFWIVLGTLLVLRSGASSTYANALQAVAGTVAGFVVAALLLLVAGDSQTALWILFPFVVAFAAYSPGAIHFVVGQAAFAVMVVVLFSLIDLPGFQTAVVRVETVTIGAVTAAALSLIMWPRGARAALSRAVAGVYAAAADGARTFVTGSTAARHAAEQALTEARRRAEAAFASALAEHSEPIDTTAWVTVLEPPTLASSLLIGLVPSVRSPLPGCRAAVEAAEASAAVAAGRLAATATRLDRRTGAVADRPTGPTSVPDAALESCIAANAGAADRRLETLAIIGWSAFISRLADDLESAEPALAAVAAASAPRAWLHGPRNAAAAARPPARPDDPAG